ncbi:MAG: hydrogenase 3 maturation endopeptidase HyCI [Anaerolineales bacterium]|nr:hydrogenase 3 maturation endopeptidase HyCI [Anaerolineales bacterium]
MSNKSWQSSLKKTLARLGKEADPLRLAVVGIGHELGGDDAVGTQLAGLLMRKAAGNERLLALEAGPAPENFTGPLRRFGPHLVLLVDAALMGCPPGTVRWLDWQQAEGFSASTHTLPLNLLATYLTAELGCELALIGIQPGQTRVDAPLTPAVRAAGRELAGVLVHCLD